MQEPHPGPQDTTEGNVLVMFLQSTPVWERAPDHSGTVPTALIFVTSLSHGAVLYIFHLLLLGGHGVGGVQEGLKRGLRQGI